MGFIRFIVICGVFCIEGILSFRFFFYFLKLVVCLI